MHFDSGDEVKCANILLDEIAKCMKYFASIDAKEFRIELVEWK